MTAGGAWWPPTGPDGHVVVCVGETMAALAPDSGARLEAADRLSLDIAGAESNVAMYLADHGIRTRWVSSLGDDPFGRRIRRQVAATGVDVSGVLTDPCRPTGVLFKDPAAEGTRVRYHRRGSAASALGPALLDGPAVEGASLLHLTGITAALSQSCHDLVDAALARRSCAVSFDVNHRPALWREPAGEMLRGLANRADIAFTGLDEAQRLWGEHLADPYAVRALLPDPRVLVVKDGSRGATAFFGASAVTVPALRVEVVEEVGAGDAFAAGFLAGLLRREPAVRALRLGHLTAAAALLVTGDHGPLPPPHTLSGLLDADEAAWASAVVTAPVSA